MALATTSSIWRSTGGDTTRTAVAGSMVMSQPFYIANVAVSANVAISGSSTALANATVILPAGAIVDGIVISASTATASIDLGFTPVSGVGPGQVLTLGTPTINGFLANAIVTNRTVIVTGGTGGGANLGVLANATNLVLVTSTANTGTTGSVSGIINYFVPSAGQENV